MSMRVDVDWLTRGGGGWDGLDCVTDIPIQPFWKATLMTIGPRPCVVEPKTAVRAVSAGMCVARLRTVATPAAAHTWFVGEFGGSPGKSLPPTTANASSRL